MIRSLRAFAWLRWRLLVNGLKGAKRRDTLETLSRLGAVFVPLALGLFFVSMALGFGFLGLAGGWVLATRGAAAAEPVIAAFRIALFGVLAMLFFFPLRGSTHTAGAGFTRLLLLPIPRRALHLVEVLAGLFDPWVVFVLPGLFLFPVGLVIGGRAGAGVAAFVAALGMVVVLGALGSLLSFLATWFLRSRRRAEVFTLVSVFLISVLSVIPMFAADRWERDLKGGGSLSRIERSLPVWTKILPSELFGSSLRGAVDGRWGTAGLATLGLFLEAGLFYAGSTAAHRRLIESAESEGRHRLTVQPRSATLRLPGLSAAASAVAVAQAKTALRSVRGRVIVLLPGPMFALLGVFARRFPDEIPGGSVLGAQGDVLFGASIVFGLYALQAFTMNQLASDRAGLTLQFLTPVSDLDLVKGKAAGCGLVFAVLVGVCLATTLLSAPLASPLAYLSVLLGAAATYLLLSPVAATLSSLFPVASDLSKTGTGGNPHGLAMLAGTLVIMTLAIPPALILKLVDPPGLALASMAVWVIVAAAIGIPALRIPARALDARRENLALVAQGR